MVFGHFFVIQRKDLHRVRDSKFYDLMIDESTNIYVKGHFVVFATFLEATMSFWIYYGLRMEKNSKMIFDIIVAATKTWQLNLNKRIGFGSDGVSL